MKRLPKRWFEVVVLGMRCQVLARTPGAAARHIFRLLIVGGVLKRQPQSDRMGGWEGVSIVATPVFSP